MFMWVPVSVWFWVSTYTNNLESGPIPDHPKLDKDNRIIATTRQYNVQ